MVFQEPIVRVHDIDPAGADGAGHRHAALRQQAHDAAQRHALAGARFAEKPEHLSLLKREANPFDGLHDPRSADEADMEVVDLDERHGQALSGSETATFEAAWQATMCPISPATGSSGGSS